MIIELSVFYYYLFSRLRFNANPTTRDQTHCLPSVKSKRDIKYKTGIIVFAYNPHTLTEMQINMSFTTVCTSEINIFKFKKLNFKKLKTIVYLLFAACGHCIECYFNFQLLTPVFIADNFRFLSIQINIILKRQIDFYYRIRIILMALREHENYNIFSFTIVVDQGMWNFHKASHRSCT